jgi:hypothetical protein
VALAVAEGAHPKAVQERLGTAQSGLLSTRTGNCFPDSTSDSETTSIEHILKQSRPQRGLSLRSSFLSSQEKQKNPPLNRGLPWSGRRDSNPPPSPWQCLPTYFADLHKRPENASGLPV